MIRTLIEHTFFYGSFTVLTTEIKHKNERTFYYIFYTLGPTVLTTDDTVCDIKHKNGVKFL
jgi:hypothetical protein